MRLPGIKASALVAQLQALIQAHGDQEVVAGGGDYPEGVRRVALQTRTDDPYVPQGVFQVR